MLFPTKDEIIDAVADSSNLIPSCLKGYSCAMGRFGPLCYHGGFCVVFKLVNGSSCKALRVWYADVANIRDRIDSLTEYFSRNKYSFIVPFTFYKQGLKVPTREGDVYLDIMIMDWVEGENIKRYVKNVLSSKASVHEKQEKLYDLACKLLDIFTTMHNAKISHGDLQHTNVIIPPNAIPILIDYDSMFFPGATYRKHITLGYDEYQHPARRKSKYANEKTDYFSELIICLSLFAYKEDETIWERYFIDSLDYSMLFTKDDFSDIDSSILYNELLHKSESLQILCEVLKDYLSESDINRLKPFMSYDGIYNVFCRLGRYCIECGKEFSNFKDVYCINCGIKRV